MSGRCVAQGPSTPVRISLWPHYWPSAGREIPWFVEFQKEYGPRGLQIIGVSMDEGEKDAIAPFVRSTRIDYVVLLGDGHVSSLYGGLEILPTTYYISPYGKVIALVNGLVSKAEVERDIKEALGSSPQN